tara:strand:- start:111 stop:941 length:831 start_codon:yes stop_codon:yes gene_type:complete
MKYKRKEKYKTLESQLEAVKEHYFAIKYIHNPSDEVQLAAVKQDGFAIKYIHNPSEEVQLAAVKQSGLTIEYIHNPSEEVQLEAVKENGFAIKYIHNPSEAVQLAAVKQDGFAIEYIHNPSDEVQLEAVKEACFAIKYIHNPSEDVIDFLKNKNIEIFDEHFKEVNNDSPVEKHIPKDQLMTSKRINLSKGNWKASIKKYSILDKFDWMVIIGLITLLFDISKRVDGIFLMVLIGGLLGTIGKAIGKSVQSNVTIISHEAMQELSALKQESIEKHK